MIVGSVVKARGCGGPLMTINRLDNGVADLVWFWNGKFCKMTCDVSLLVEACPP